MFVILIYRHKGLKEEWKLISEHSLLDAGTPAWPVQAGVRHCLETQEGMWLSLLCSLGREAKQGSYLCT